MISTLRISALLAIFAGLGCTPQLEEEPRCRLTADGWICDDGASPPDSGTDMGPAPGDTGEVVEMGPASDMDEPDMMQETTPTSCVELRDRGDTGRGLRTIDLVGEEVEVFCEQDLDGGGWMLVGRSVAGATGNFGWGTARGSVGNDAEPFSLGRTDIAVSELLIGDRGDGKTWGNRIYRVALPNDFLNACSGTACQTTVTKVTGTCDNPSMFNFAGFVGRTDSYWLRDVSGEVPYGLLPDGWSVFYDDCRGGELEGRQGMLFVR